MVHENGVVTVAQVKDCLRALGIDPEHHRLLALKIEAGAVRVRIIGHDGVTDVFYRIGH